MLTSSPREYALSLYCADSAGCRSSPYLDYLQGLSFTQRVIQLSSDMLLQLPSVHTSRTEYNKEGRDQVYKVAQLLFNAKYITQRPEMHDFEKSSQMPDQAHEISSHFGALLSL